MYLVIETVNDKHEFMHFINLNNDESLQNVKYFLEHLNRFPNQKVVKVYISKTRLTNW